MGNRILPFLTKPYPQNYIFRHPFLGALFIGVFTFLFTVIYQPLEVKGEQFGLITTMAIYSFAMVLPVVPFILLLKRWSLFSPKHIWLFWKELLFVILLLLALGIYVYLLAFIVEPPADRWNLSTFWDSLKNTFLIEAFPFLFFTVQGYKHLLAQAPEQTFNTPPSPDKTSIQIHSQLKKENLSFAPNAFLYAESDGNYVNFYLRENDAVSKKMVRNSMTNIEHQLAAYPHFMRTHRAFIVNLKKIQHQQGNASGYRLKLEGLQEELPVSRQKVPAFERLLKQLEQ